MIESLHDTAIHIYIFLNDHNTQHYIFPNLGYGLVLEFSYVTILHRTTYIHTHSPRSISGIHGGSTVSLSRVSLIPEAE